MKTLTGKWQNLDGTPVAGGRVFLKLSQDAVALNTTQVSTALISFNLDANGSIVAGSQFWANDELSPSGTTYSVSVIAAGGGTVWGAENISLVGSSPININNATPASGSTISTAIPVLQNPSAVQTITGFDLNLAGANLNITTGNLVTTVGNATIGGSETVGGTLGVTGNTSLSSATVSSNLTLSQTSDLQFGSIGLTAPDLFLSRLSNSNLALGSTLNGTDGFLNSGGLLMANTGLIKWGTDTSLSRQTLTPNTVQAGDGGANGNGTFRATNFKALSTITIFGSVSGSTNMTTDNTSTKLNVSTPVNATTGFQIGGAAAANTFLKGNGTNYISGSPVLASADFASQGTTTTVLHGNAAGNPSFAAVSLTADVSGVLPQANMTAPTGTGFAHTTAGAWDAASKLVNLTASTDVAANQGTTTTVLHGNAAGQASFAGVSLTADASANQGSTTTVLHGNAAGQPSFAAVSLTADVSGILPTANGGTNQNSTATFPTSGVVVTEAATETLTNKTLNSATSGNSVSLISSLKQDSTAQLTGNSADQTIWTFTVPGGTLESGKGIDFDIWATHDVGTATITWKLTYGTAVVSVAIGGTSPNIIHFKAFISNNNGVTNAQKLGMDAVTTNSSNTGSANGAVDTTASQTLTFSFNIANTDKITGISLRPLKF